MNLNNKEKLTMLLFIGNIIKLSSVCVYLNNCLISNEPHPLFNKRELSFFYEKERKNLSRQVYFFNKKYTTFGQKEGFVPIILEGHNLKNVFHNLF